MSSFSQIIPKFTAFKIKIAQIFEKLLQSRAFCDKISVSGLKSQKLEDN